MQDPHHCALAMPALSKFDEEPRREQHRLRNQDFIIGAGVLQGCRDDAVAGPAAADGLGVAGDRLGQPMPLLFGPELQQALHGEVAEAVARELDGLLHQGLCELADLRCGALLQQLLHNSTTVAVACNRCCQAITLQELIKHELQGVWFHDTDALLEYMICMWIAHGLYRVAMELLKQGLPGLVRRTLVQRILHPSTSRWILAEQPDVSRHGTLTAHHHWHF
mmetsp:Transcript_10707/g.28646  ORF Transcript_10707/g.28646 Transcript_10707/m.28646 type:complete len:222 (+) Transcript_10707:405-1070(+)